MEHDEKNMVPNAVVDADSGVSNTNSSIWNHNLSLTKILKGIITTIDIRIFINAS